MVVGSKAWPGSDPELAQPRQPRQAFLGRRLRCWIPAAQARGRQGLRAAREVVGIQPITLQRVRTPNKHTESGANAKGDSHCKPNAVFAQAASSTGGSEQQTETMSVEHGTRVAGATHAWYNKSDGRALHIACEDRRLMRLREE